MNRAVQLAAASMVALYVLVGVALGLGLSAARAQSYSPPFVSSVEGTGTPGLDGVPLFFWYSGPFSATPTLRIDRHVGSGSGQSWNTYKGLWVLGSTNPNNAGFEWTITGEQHNNSLASLGAQNVAVNGTIFKETPPGGGSVGPSWGGNFVCTDNTGEVDPVAACLGIEVDVGAKAGAGTDRNRQRVGMQIVGGGAPDVHTGYGILMGTNQGVIDTAFRLQNGYGTGLDLSAASFSGAAISLAPESWLAFDGNGAGGFGHFMGMHAGKVSIVTPYGIVFALADDGAATFGRVIENIPHVPSSSSAPCQTGEHAWDANFEYRCIGTNTWRRAALNPF